MGKTRTKEWAGRATALKVQHVVYLAALVNSLIREISEISALVSSLEKLAAAQRGEAMRNERRKTRREIRQEMVVLEHREMMLRRFRAEVEAARDGVSIHEMGLYR